MKNLQDVINAQRVKLVDTVQSQKNAYKALDDLKQEWQDTTPDLPFSEPVKKALDSYLKLDSATELWNLDAYKAMKRSAFLEAKAAFLPLPTDNLTPEIIEKYRTVMENGVFVRMKKLADNYDIAIERAKEKMLLLQLVQYNQGTPAEDIEYFKDFVDNALSEKKAKTSGWLPEIGMDYMEVIKHYTDAGKSPVDATKLAGSAIARAGLTVGVGYKLVKA